MPDHGYSGSRHNGYVLTLIVAGHIAALTALLLYRMEVTFAPPNTGIITENIPIVPPPPIEPPPPQREVDTPPAQDRSAITSVPPLIPVPSDGPVVQPAPFDDVVTPAMPGPADTGGSAVVPIIPIVPAVPEPAIEAKLQPIAAKPRGNPSAWVTNDDYPASALRNEEQGRTTFRLAIAADGRPTSCTITASSGTRSLDDAACRLLMRRARFVAARGVQGEAVAGNYANSFLWQIPAD